MEKKQIRLSYDKESDVLYITFGIPSFGIDEETEDGIFIRRNETHREVIGITVMDFEKRFSSNIKELLLPVSSEYSEYDGSMRLCA